MPVSVQPVFVVGNPRSGTTLVQQILSAHEEFWTAPETHIFNAGLTKGSAPRRVSADDVSALLKRLAKRSRTVLPEPAREALLAEAAAGGMDEAQLVDGIMRALKQPGDAAVRWVEKTPHHIRHIPRILRFFPDAKVIHVLRDPRDVVSSPKRFRSAKPGRRRAIAVIKIAERWRRYVDTFDKQASDPRLLTVRYEDLIAEPEAALRRLAAHVGIKPDPTALERFGAQFDAVTLATPSAENKAFNNEGGLVDRRGIWKKRLTPREARFVEAVCAHTMAKHGYAAEYAPGRATAAEIWFWNTAVAARKRLRRIVGTGRGAVSRLLRRVGIK